MWLPSVLCWSQSTCWHNFCCKTTPLCPFITSPGAVWEDSELQARMWLSGSKVEQWTRSSGCWRTLEQEAVWLQAVSFADPSLHSLTNAQTGTSCQVFLGFHSFLQAFLCPQAALETNSLLQDRNLRSEAEVQHLWEIRASLIFF